jgi:hypothetical protein
VSVAAGLGANVLVGGSSRTVALQPLSLQGQVGLDVAAGVGQLDLHPAQYLRCSATGACSDREVR